MYDWRPRLTVKRVLEWADAHYRRKGDWPTQTAGRVWEEPAMTWNAVNLALMDGRHGHPGGTSLVRMLAKYRGRRNKQDLPRLTMKQILKWADAYRKRSGHWPKATCGPVPGSGGETWTAIEVALKQGHRGLRGGSSVARLLAKHRGKRDWYNQPRLSNRQILVWADSYHKRTGRWPTHKSGSVPGVTGESWIRVSTALCEGHRGLSGGLSLARLLALCRGVRNHMDLPPLTITQILAWADRHYQRTGRWPTGQSGAIRGGPGETWKAINHSLRLGTRSLPGGSSLAQLLDKRRRNRGG